MTYPNTAGCQYIAVRVDAMETIDCVDEFSRIKSRYPRLFGKFKTDFQWDFVRNPSSFGFFFVYLWIDWILLQVFSKITGPPRWRFFQPHTLLDGIFTVRDVFVSKMTDVSKPDGQNVRLNFTQMSYLLTQSMTAFIQCLSLFLGLPALIFGFITLGTTGPSNLPNYINYLLLPPFLLVGWPLLVIALYLVAIPLGLVLLVFAVMVGFALTGLSHKLTKD